MNDRDVEETRQWNADGVVRVDDVKAAGETVADRPRGVFQRLERAARRRHERPVGFRIGPPDLTSNTRLTIRIHDNVVAAIAQGFGQVGDEQFGAAVSGGRDGNKRRSNNRDAHGWGGM